MMPEFLGAVNPAARMRELHGQMGKFVAVTTKSVL
jgi:hypothetical protein